MALARDAAKPMIVVMPDARVGTNLGRPAGEDPFPRELVRGVVPAVERRYEYGETPGHEWPAWQRYLRELLRVFRETEFIEP